MTFLGRDLFPEIVFQKAKMVATELKNHQQTIQKVIDTLVNDIEAGCDLVKAAINGGKKIFLAGNGGSAADAQHIAAELSGRFLKERRPLPGLALTTDTSALTAIANDYGYDKVFSRQLEAFASKGDIFIGISTSGNSKNILDAFNAAKKINCVTIGLSGRDGGEMNNCCDLNIVVPSDVTARIQEIHILIGHIFCKAIDDLF